MYLLYIYICIYPFIFNFRNQFSWSLHVKCSMSDFKDLWMNDEVVQSVCVHIFARVPSELPASLLVVAATFLAEMFNQNISDERGREDWAIAAIGACDRLLTELTLFSHAFFSFFHFSS